MRFFSKIKEGKAAYSSQNIIRRIFRDYVLHYKKKVLFSVFLMIIVAAGDGLLVLLIKPALDEVLISKNLNLFWMIPLLIVAIACIKGVADYGQNYTIKSVGQTICNDIQLKLYSHLVHSDLEILNQTSSGHILSKFTNDILNIKQAITSSIVNVAKEMLTVIFFIGVMFYYDHKLAFATFFIFLFMVLPIIKGGKKMKKITFKTQDKLAEYIKHLNERLHNIKIIKAFCCEKYEIKEGKKYLDDILGFYKNSIKIESIASPITETLASIAVAVVIAYGGQGVLKGTTTPGSLFTFISALILAYKPLKGLANMNIVLQTGVASAKRILTVIDTKNAVEDDSKKVPLKVGSGQIKFENVSFFFDEKRPVIQSLSLKINPGQVVAIVGESGSGKSTLIDLLLKFYEPTKGKVSIGGQSLAEVTTNSIRNNISLVNQEIMLFDTSVKENIAYGTGKHDQEAIVAAAEVADAQEFILNMQQKYDTLVGKFGIKLSGGQRQRLAIARAVLKDAPILILDEATSSLDQVTELNVKNAILNLKVKYKAIIIITHRLNTIKSSDVIYVMKKGKLIEFGKHKELLDNKGEYYRLYNKRILN